MCLPLDLPLPRFAGLKNEPEMRYSSVPAGVDGAQGGAAPASVPWTPADRSAFRHLEASAEKKVSVGRRFQSHKTSGVTVKSSYCLTCLIETHDFEFRRELFFFTVDGVDKEWCTELKHSSQLYSAEQKCYVGERLENGRPP